MSKYFFKKHTPDTAVTLAGGGQVKFSTVDGLIGYFYTDNDALAGELKGMIEQQRYGMSEISEAEFHQDYVEVKKKGRVVPGQANWQRESLGSKGYEPGTHPLAALPAEVVSRKVAVAGRDAVMEDNPPDDAPPMVPKEDPKAPPPVVVGGRKKAKVA